mmetsp:Transcript_16154/g.26373  ORF Transcript_16154/g.26373 Transcript_16154/m.26373 type:complete len:243 (+) Transcript_16154:192-920(+)
MIPREFEALWHGVVKVYNSKPLSVLFFKPFCKPLIPNAWLSKGIPDYINIRSVYIHQHLSDSNSSMCSNCSPKTVPSNPYRRHFMFFNQHSHPTTYLPVQRLVRIVKAFVHPAIDATVPTICRLEEHVEVVDVLPRAHAATKRHDDPLVGRIISNQPLVDLLLTLEQANVLEGWRGRHLGIVPAAQLAPPTFNDLLVLAGNDGGIRYHRDSDILIVPSFLVLDKQTLPETRGIPIPSRHDQR